LWGDRWGGLIQKLRVGVHWGTSCAGKKESLLWMGMGSKGRCCCERYLNKWKIFSCLGWGMAQDSGRCFFRDFENWSKFFRFIEERMGGCRFFFFFFARGKRNGIDLLYCIRMLAFIAKMSLVERGSGEGLWASNNFKF